MAYLMLKYQDPTTYALVDLDQDQFAIVGRALRELLELYERMEAPVDQTEPIEALIGVMERLYGDEIE